MSMDESNLIVVFDAKQVWQMASNRRMFRFPGKHIEDNVSNGDIPFSSPIRSEASCYF